MRALVRGGTPRYAWVIAAMAMLVVLGAVGLARFAFGMVLPAMAGDLMLGYREQGLLGASYFVGYLAVIALMPWLAPKLGARRLCAAGLAVVAIGLTGMSVVRDYALLSAAYLTVGIGSGAAFIGAMSLPALWFHSSHRARAAGVATAGAGLGILASGLVVPLIPAAFNMASWQLTWLVFAATAAGFAVLAHAVVRDRPAELALTPYGRPGPGAAGGRRKGAEPMGRWRFLLHLGAIYLLFAATALTYTTFIVTTMVDGYGIDTATAGLLWAGVGGLSIFSGALFGSISDRFGHRSGMASALLVQMAAYGLVAGGSGTVGLGVSIVLFGMSAWSMPSIVAAAAGDYLGAEQAAGGFAILTLMFAVGQVMGPAGAGVLADWTGGFAASYGVAAGLCALAAGLCGSLRPPAHG